MILLKKVCKGYCPVTKTQREIIVVYIPVYDVTTGGDHERNTLECPDAKRCTAKKGCPIFLNANMRERN